MSTLEAERPETSGRVDRPEPEERRGHFPPLDGLRGVAILLVLVAHAFEPVETGSGPVHLARTVARGGWVGVNLFFVLSGFLIGGILVDSRGQPGYFRTFYARRSLRIFPLYYAFLLLFFYVAVPLGRMAGMPILETSGKWTFFAYLANFRDPLVNPYPNALAPLWSLSVEEQIYLIWPTLIAFIPRRALVQVMAVLVPAAFLWRVGALALHRSIAVAEGWTPGCLDAFAMGTIAAVVVRSAPDRVALKGRALAVLTASGLFLLGLSIGQGHFCYWDGPKAVLTVGLTALPAFFASVIVYLVRDDLSGPANRLLSTSWLRALGKYSYAIYLVHMGVRDVLLHFAVTRFGHSRPFTSVPGQFVFLLAVLLVSYLLALVSWNVLEKPALALKRAFPSRGRGVPDLSEAARPS